MVQIVYNYTYNVTRQQMSFVIITKYSNKVSWRMLRKCVGEIKHGKEGEME